MMMGTGSHTFTVHPFALTQKEIDAFPLLDKTTRFDFSINSGQTTETRSILLRQIHYNLLTEYTPADLLDGKRKTIVLKSNTGWRIKSIEQMVSDPAKSILNLSANDNLHAGFVGGYNHVGDTLSFTVANDRSFWGKLSVTLESTNNPKRFADTTITLIFALPRVRIIGIGNSGANNCYNPASSCTANSSNSMLIAPSNFGLQESSTVYSFGFDFTAYDVLISNANMQVACNNADILVLTYSFTASSTQADILASFVKSGGVLIALWEHSGGIQNVLRNIFGGNTINASTINTGGAIYQIEDTVSDLITNGVFGDLRGKHWGEDVTPTAAVQISTMPAGSYTLYTNGYNHTNNNNGSVGYATAFMLNDYPLFFAGDGGFTSANKDNSTTSNAFQLDSNFAPIPKLFGASTRFDVYNSAMFGNIIVWGISQTGKKN
jgi:hypothetical protein